GRSPRRPDRADDLLRGRDLRRRQGNRLAGVSRLRSVRQRVQRRGQLGPDRPRKGRPGPPDQPRGAPQGGDGGPITASPSAGSSAGRASISAVYHTRPGASLKSWGRVETLTGG